MQVGRSSTTTVKRRSRQVNDLFLVDAQCKGPTQRQETKPALSVVTGAGRRMWGAVRQGGTGNSMEE